MWRASGIHRMLFQAMRLLRPPPDGYPLAEMPNEAVLADFVQDSVGKVVVAFVIPDQEAGYGTAAVQDGKKFLGILHRVPLGDPNCVRLAVIGASRAPRLMQRSEVLALPTTLIFWKKDVVETVVGLKPRELSVKVRFLLRREGLNVFAV